MSISWESSRLTDVFLGVHAPRVHRRPAAPRFGRRIRVLVGDANAALCENIRQLLDAQVELACVGVATEGRQLVALCLDLKPDVLVLARHMPGVDAVALATMLERTLPALRVIQYTMNDNVCSVAQSSGATACISDAPFDSLLSAIRHGETPAQDG